MQFGDLRVDVTKPAGQVRLDWHGKGNERNPELTLTPFLADIGKQAADDKLVVDIHFEALEFVNSSTITVIVRFVKYARANALPLEISFNPAKKWQKMFLDSLWLLEKPDGLIKIHPVVP